MGGDSPKPQRGVCQVSIWHAATSTDRAGDFEHRCEQLLDPEELIRANRFRRTTNRNQHVVGRAMAKRLLAADGVSSQSVRFAVGDFGKPHVANPPRVRRSFNIAHTDGLVLCGIGDGPSDLVGVDVEKFDRRTNVALAERYFSEPEIAYLSRCRSDSQKSQFLRIWTLKEAFIKAIGTGLHTPLCDFAFTDIDTDRPSIRFLAPELDDGRLWQFVCSEPRPGYIAAAAVAPGGGGEEVRLDWRPFESLMGET